VSVTPFKIRTAKGWRLVGVLAMGPFIAALMYFSAYLATGTRSINPTRDTRFYRHEWQARVFVPAAQLESAIRGKQVLTGWFANP
jgi:hypothetical protein